MAVNLVVLDGVVKSLALRFDSQAKPELRWTLVATDQGPDGQPWTSYWPCCASGSAATRLAEGIENDQHIILTNAKLCYRKRSTKFGEQSRMEILVWQVEKLQDDSAAGGGVVPEGAAEIVEHEPTSAKPPRRPRLPAHLKQPWIASRLEGSEN